MSLLRPERGVSLRLDEGEEDVVDDLGDDGVGELGSAIGAALLNTIAATATASYVTTHGHSFAAAGVVHGFSVALAVGAGFLALAAIVSAVFVTAGTSDLSDAAVVPALADP